MSNESKLRIIKRDYTSTDSFFDAVSASLKNVPRVREQTITPHVAVVEGDRAMLRIVAENIGDAHKIDGPK
jgi:hypothetical protein